MVNDVLIEWVQFDTCTCSLFAGYFINIFERKHRHLEPGMSRLVASFAQCNQQVIRILPGSFPRAGYRIHMILTVVNLQLKSAATASTPALITGHDHFPALAPAVVP